MALDIQRPVSLACVQHKADGYWPLVSHLTNHKWRLHRCTTEQEAIAYVEAIWPGIYWCAYTKWQRETKGAAFTH